MLLEEASAKGFTAYHAAAAEFFRQLTIASAHGSDPRAEPDSTVFALTPPLLIPAGRMPSDYVASEGLP